MRLKGGPGNGQLVNIFLISTGDKEWELLTMGYPLFGAETN